MGICEHNKKFIEKEYKYIVLGVVEDKNKFHPRGMPYYKNVVYACSTDEDVYDCMKSLLMFRVYAFGGEDKDQDTWRAMRKDYLENQEKEKRRELYNVLKKEFES